MSIVAKVRERVRKFFNPESFDAAACRNAMMMGLLGLSVMEVVVAVQLQNSADLGELPHSITDALIIAISSLEVLLAPFLCWVGMQRRRSVMFGWNLFGLIATIIMFALPHPETTQDAGLCSAVGPRNLPTWISMKAAVRLTLLIICGLGSALGRTSITGHSLAYINEQTPSVNLHMHVGILILNRVAAYLAGSALKYQYIEKPWIQLTILIIQFLIGLLRLSTYPNVAPGLAKSRWSDRGLFRSMGRVLSNGVVVLIMLSMALLIAAWWGFGTHETKFVQVKYNFRPELDPEWGFLAMLLKLAPVLLGVLLAGYMYTTPVMPKYDRKAAVSSASHMCIRSAVVFFILTAVLSCAHGGVAGAGGTYSQPACGRNCGCDHPWMQYTPVCEQEQMTTYFSPCHAGCTSTEIVNSVSVYSNCTCAPSGRVTAGPCTDGSCAGAYAFHQMLVVLLAIFVTTAIVCMITVVLETVDRRDVAVAVGVMSSVVSLFAFVGAHGFYMGITLFTCMFDRGSKCLLQNSLFVPWIGYSSAVLAILASILSTIAYIILRRQKEPQEEETGVEPL